MALSALWKVNRKLLELRRGLSYVQCLVKVGCHCHKQASAEDGLAAFM